MIANGLRVIVGISLFTAIPALAATCRDMGSLQVDTVTITETESKAAGMLEQRLNGPVSLPAHCRLAVVLSPSDDSHIEMELWLPDNWNGKFLAVGNGGWAGAISYSAMARGLQAGFAVASNDTGHKGDSAAFVPGHPEKLVDFGWRAMHEMAEHSKTLIEHYYERVAQHSYYQGCSTGGRQGMMAAQRFPADFDGIIVGAPVNNMFVLAATQLHNLKTLIENQDMALSREKVVMLHEKVLSACEANDGVVDGFLNDPLACDFDPAALLCEGPVTSSCLSEDELSAVNNAYAGTYSQAGEQLYPGLAKGFELGWRVPAADSEPPSLQTDSTRYVGYEDPAWDWREFELERDLALVIEKAPYFEAMATDLSEFKARGGKLLFYHGWNDPGPSPLNTLNYYNSVLDTMGQEQDDWMRVFMMPGMGHCGGGIGPDNADFLGAMEAWVEAGIAPDRITAARIREGRVNMTRPLCPYPEVATWDRSGNANDAASYSCANE